MAVVKIAYADEIAGGKNSQDWVLLLTHWDYSYVLMNHQADVDSFVTRGNCSPEN